MLTTFTGKRLDLLNITEDDVSINDVAHSLALINRFNGHTDRPISVAQHSVFVSALCEGMGYEMQGLLHDAAEAYLGDVTKWLKGTKEMAPYRALEDKVHAAVMRKFHLPVALAVPVLSADRLMVRFEAQQAGLDIGWIHGSYGAPTEEETKRILDLGWGFMGWEEAEHLFLVRYGDLLHRDYKQVIG